MISNHTSCNVQSRCSSTDRITLKSVTIDPDYRGTAAGCCSVAIRQPQLAVLEEPQPDKQSSVTPWNLISGLHV